MAIRGARRCYIAGHVTGDVKQAVKLVAGEQGVSAFVSRSIVHELQRVTTSRLTILKHVNKLLVDLDTSTDRTQTVLDFLDEVYP